MSRIDDSINSILLQAQRTYDLQKARCQLVVLCFSSKWFANISLQVNEVYRRFNEDVCVSYVNSLDDKFNEQTRGTYGDKIPLLSL